MNSSRNGHIDATTLRLAPATNEKSIYQPLNELTREIRLLRILCDGDTAVRCELGVASLNDRPDFEALSYCWTKAEPTCKIFINDRSFLVRPNLFDSLKLRHGEADVRRIFIDAVCINQQDVAERSSQVTIMGDVYREAARVVVWLGKADPWPPEWRPGQPREIDIIQQHCEEPDKPQFLDRELRVLVGMAFKRAFLPQAYWSRAWIVQEVALSRSLLFRDGNLTLDGGAFQSLLELVDTSGDDQTLPLMRRPSLAGTDYHSGEPINSIPGYDVFMLQGDLYDSHSRRGAVARAAMALSRRAREGSTCKIRFTDAVRAFSGQQCSERHDGVYALLGLTDATIPVNYSMSPVELYIRALLEGVHETDLAHRPFPLMSDIDFIASLFRAVNVLPYDTTVALLTQRVLEARGIHDSAPMLELAAAERDRRSHLTIKMLIQRTQLRIDHHRHSPQTIMQAPESEVTRTYSEWISWVDRLIGEIAARPHQARDARKAISCQAGLKASLAAPRWRLGI